MWCRETRRQLCRHIDLRPWPRWPRGPSNREFRQKSWPDWQCWPNRNQPTWCSQRLSEGCFQPWYPYGFGSADEGKKVRPSNLRKWQIFLLRAKELCELRWCPPRILSNIPSRAILCVLWGSIRYNWCNWGAWVFAKIESLWGCLATFPRIACHRKTFSWWQRLHWWHCFGHSTPHRNCHDRFHGDRQKAYLDLHFRRVRPHLDPLDCRA